MRYRIVKRWTGWVVELWDGCKWIGIHWPVKEQVDAERIKDILEGRDNER